MRSHLFLVLPILFLLIFGSPSLALDLAHWDEKRLRSNSSTIWMLLSGKCSNVSNPAKKPLCDEQIRKWQNHREGNKEGEEKPVQVISHEKGGRISEGSGINGFSLMICRLFHFFSFYP